MLAINIATRSVKRPRINNPIKNVEIVYNSTIGFIRPSIKKCFNPIIK